jgi:hypothetical protein
MEPSASPYIARGTIGAGRFESFTACSFECLTSGAHTALSLVMTRQAFPLCLLLLIVTPAVARSQESTVRLVCQLQKTEYRPGGAHEESRLERAEVNVVRSRDQMTISGTGIEIGFSVSSLDRREIVDQDPHWGITRVTTSDTGSPIVDTLEQVHVGRPGKKPGNLFYNRLQSEQDSHQKRHFLAQTQIKGKCRPR